MKIGVLRVYFMIHDAQSLKQKRQVLRSLKDRLLNKFNISVAEIGCNDKWQLGELGMAAVGNDAKFVGSVMEEVKNYIQLNPAVSIIESAIEVI
ncbi:MAG TPA: DUF503 domain-containing protein [Planctomycetota bacterium]|nr:DUF503 domain-containing protein [Planctomycetota bacterium]